MGDLEADEVIPAFFLVISVAVVFEVNVFNDRRDLIIEFGCINHSQRLAPAELLLPGTGPE
jgi:hypothetical protein